MFEHLDDPNPIPMNGDARRAVEGRRQTMVRRRRAGAAGVVSLAVLVAAGGVAFAVSGNQRSGQSIHMTTQPPSPTSTSVSTSVSTVPPTAAPSTTVAPAPAVTAPTTSTVPMPPQALVCGKLDASNGPASATATDGTVTAVLSGVETSPGTTFPYLENATMTIRSAGVTVLRMAVGGPLPNSQLEQGKGPIAWSTGGSSTAAAVTLGPLCLARFAGSPYLSALFLYYGSGAHCCFAISAIPVTGPDVGKQVFQPLGNASAQVAEQGGDAVLVTADNRFAYAFGCYACSGMPIQVDEVENGQFVDRTRDFRDLIATDGSQWWRAFENSQNAGDGNGVLAAWVADKCLLGQKTAAFATVDQLDQQGRLQSPSGWPSGSGYVSALRTFLAQTGYC